MFCGECNPEGKATKGGCGYRLGFYTGGGGVAFEDPCKTCHPDHPGFIGGTPEQVLGGAGLVPGTLYIADSVHCLDKDDKVWAWGLWIKGWIWRYGKDIVHGEVFRTDAGIYPDMSKLTLFGKGTGHEGKNKVYIWNDEDLAITGNVGMWWWSRVKGGVWLQGNTIKRGYVYVTGFQPSHPPDLRNMEVKP